MRAHQHRLKSRFGTPMASDCDLATLNHQLSSVAQLAKEANPPKDGSAVADESSPQDESVRLADSTGPASFMVVDPDGSRRPD